MKLFSTVQLGYLVALALSLGLMFLGWGWVYTPGSSGSNVMLGILLALALVYLLTANLGPFFQDRVFHGGDPKRATLVRQAGILMREGTKLLKTTEKKRFAQSNGGAVEVPGQAVRDGVADLERALGEGNERVGTPLTTDELETKVNRLHEELERLASLNKPKRRLGDFSSLVVAFALAYALRAFFLEPFQIPSGSMIPTLLVGDHLFVSKSTYGIVKPFGSTGYWHQWSEPQPGEVVVFEAPPYVGPNHGEAWIKRVVAGPGQTVFMKESVLHVDGEPYTHERMLGQATYKDYQDVTRQWLPAVADHRVEDINDHRHSIYISSPTQLDWPTLGFDGRPLQLPGLKCGPSSCTVAPGHIFVMGDNRDNSSDGRRWGAVPIENVKGKALFIWMSVDGSQNSVSIGNFVLPNFRWDRWLMKIL
ncbi:MAG: signal peptidase I [Myxococcales bacterium]|nr:signal peptidase I [Myxococcales bacterium]